MTVALLHGPTLFTTHKIGHKTPNEILYSEVEMSADMEHISQVCTHTKRQKKKPKKTAKSF